MAIQTWRWDGTQLDTASKRALRESAAAQHHYLLLLSHMRSYSSLLAHLLGSSPEIEGYGEAHVRYRHPWDLWRLRRSIQRSTGRELRGRWMLDKILHNHIRPPDRLVDREFVRAVIFIREPEPSLQSMLALARVTPDGGPMRDPQRCCDYYVSRLHRLREDGERLGSAAIYFDAEALVERPHALLSGLGDWLGLRQPLRTGYAVGVRSGECGFGDPSDNIRAGRILAAEATTVRQPERLDPMILVEAEAAYRRCRDALLRHCRGLPGAPN
jgi:hypothetical protein